MKPLVNNLLPYFIILVSAFFLVGDLFFKTGMPATFDAPIHVTMIAQFYQALKQGDFPVTWADGFANYGMPMPLIHQQTAAYLGAVVNFLVNNVVLSYKIVMFVGAFLSLLFFYLFLRLHFSKIAAMAGSFFFNFAPYRIFNIYVRGAQPEFLASVFVPLILIGLYLLVKQKKKGGFFLLIFSTCFLILSHPFVFVISGFIFIPYLAMLLIGEKKKICLFVWSGFSFLLGIMLAFYYLMPLVMELKYFYYGQSANHLAPNQFLSWQNILSEQWFYFYKDGEFNRGNFIMAGILEAAVFLAGVVYLIFQTKTGKKITFLTFAVVSGSILLFFTASFSAVFYQKINLLSSIQHPWRMLSGFIFIPAMILAYFTDKWKKYALMILFLSVGIIAILRFPQIYVKNNARYSQKDYYFTTENLAATILNTVWTGVTRDYPVKTEKIEIIEGEAKIIEKKIKNASRQYSVEAKTNTRLVDYTFYFPGWKVYVDGQPTEIEFQDPRYRGVITYRIPAGKHLVKLVFEDTKVRTTGKIITAFTLFTIVCLFILLKKRKICPV